MLFNNKWAWHFQQSLFYHINYIWKVKEIFQIMKNILIKKFKKWISSLECMKNLFYNIIIVNNIIWEQFYLNFANVVVVVMEKYVLIIISAKLRLFINKLANLL